MNRTVKDATIKIFHYPFFDALKTHVRAFITAYNFAKHLKALRRRPRLQLSAMPGLKYRIVSSFNRTISLQDHTPRKSGAIQFIAGAIQLSGPSSTRGSLYAVIII